MIHDLDRTLRELIRLELPSTLVDPVTISFDTPDEDFPPSGVTPPAIDLFLYDVRENRELRSNEWEVERESDGSLSRQRPPVRVDCSYLVTAWASDSSNDRPHDEHLLLGDVMEVLLRHSTIPAEVLQGSLVDQVPPLPTTTLQPGRLQSLGEFWQALGGKPKAALNYTVTISVKSGMAVIVGPPVTDKRLRFRQGTEGAGP